jgi:hypothetical protein
MYFFTRLKRTLGGVFKQTTVISFHNFVSDFILFDDISAWFCSWRSIVKWQESVRKSVQVASTQAPSFFSSLKRLTLARWCLVWQMSQTDKPNEYLCRPSRATKCQIVCRTAIKMVVFTRTTLHSSSIFQFIFKIQRNKKRRELLGFWTWTHFFSFGSTAQFRPWPPPWDFPFHFSY